MTIRIVPNPAYEGRKPTLLTPACHDGTPSLDVQCDCGHQMHVHESQITEYAFSVIISTCHGCGEPLVFPSGFFPEAFGQMRADGWIA